MTMEQLGDEKRADGSGGMCDVFVPDDCPFCGNDCTSVEKTGDGLWQAVCSNCGAAGPKDVSCEEAAIRWGSVAKSEEEWETETKMDADAVVCAFGHFPSGGCECMTHMEQLEAAIVALRAFADACPQEAVARVVKGGSWAGCIVVDDQGRYDDAEGPCSPARESECWRQYLSGKPDKEVAA